MVSQYIEILYCKSTYLVILSLIIFEKIGKRKQIFSSTDYLFNNLF